MILFIFGILSIYSTGYVIRRLVFMKSRELLSPTQKFGLDFGFGSGALSLIFFYMSFFSVHLSRPKMLSAAIFFVCAAIVITAYDIAVKKIAFSDNLLRFSVVRKVLYTFLHHKKEAVIKIKSEKYRPGKLSMLLLVIISISVAVISFKSLYYPMYEWASRSCFGFKAKILHETGNIYDKTLLDKEFVLEHPEYPMLVPMLENWMYTVMDTGDDRFGKGFLPFVAIAFLCSIYAAQRKFCGSLHSLVFTALYSLIYVFVYRFACAEADAPLAFYYFSAGACLYLWICFNRFSYIIASSLFTAFAIFTKNEATSFFAILSAALFLSLIFNDRMKLKDKAAVLFTYAALVIVVSMPWLIYRFRLPSTDILVNEKSFFNPKTISMVMANFNRTGEIINNFVFDIVLRTRKWNLFWILFFVIQIASFRDLFRKQVVYLTFIVWATLSLYYLMFIVVDLDPAHMLIGMDRFGLQVSGLVLLLMSLLACKNGLTQPSRPWPRA